MQQNLSAWMLAKLQTTMNSSVVTDQLKANMKLAQDLQLLGTPAFFIAKSDVTQSAQPSAIVFIPGTLDQAQLQQIVSKISQ